MDQLNSPQEEAALLHFPSLPLLISPLAVAKGPAGERPMQRVQAEPGRQTHFDAFKLEIVAFGEASAVNDSGGILLTDPHKRLILYVYVTCV